MNTEQKIQLTVLMPCLNEARTLGACITQAQAFMVSSGIHGEILVADNGSTDGSQAIAEAHGARVIHVHARGYGAALITGISQARGLWVIMADSDASYDFRHLEPFIEALRQGNQLVIGNRFSGGIEKGAMPFLHKYLGNPVLSFIGRLFFKCRIGDFHCGLRAFDRHAILSLGLRCQGMEFASEMIVKAALAGLKITEVPTTLAPDGRDRPTHLRTWSDGWRHLRFLLLFAPRWLLLYPGLLTFFIGLFQVVVILAPIKMSNHWPVGIHTLLLSSTLMIIGIQIILFAIGVILAKWHISSRLAIGNEIFLIKFVNKPAFPALGLFLFTAGAYLIVDLTLQWRSEGFGALAPELAMRRLIPGITSTIIGTQILLSMIYFAAVRSTFELLGLSEHKQA